MRERPKNIRLSGMLYKNVWFLLKCINLKSSQCVSLRDVSLFSGGGEGHYFGGEGHNFFPLVWGRVINFFKVF